MDKKENLEGVLPDWCPHVCNLSMNLGNSVDHFRILTNG